MKKQLTFIALLLLSIGFAQNSQKNLDFEMIEDGKAKNWNVFGQGDYKVSYVEGLAQNGKTCALIETTGSNTEFNALAFNIPADFGGKRIKLTGYLKTEDVQGGWAGLWMRIDPQVAFDNMQNRGITGTTEWTKYEIELDLKSSAKQVVVGGILVGSGKVWVDNLEVTIDGKSLENAPEKELTKAQKDKTFDKGSNMAIADLKGSSSENLELLGKIWGFLKYYHPAIGKGDYNWDYELFRVLPEYLMANTNAQRDEKLLSWINSYGEVSECKDCREIDSKAFLKPDFNWFSENDMSSDLKEKLIFIKQNRHQGEHYYIGMMPGVGNPEFKNENAYSDMPYPDPGFRLLALYRYWNMINYYFPYKHLIDKDWSRVLKEKIPEFIEAKDELAYEKAMIKLIGEVKDTHANLWRGRDKFQEELGENYPPFNTMFIEDQLTILDYYDPKMQSKVGLQIGDVITHINGKAIPELVKAMEEFYPASNQPTRLRDIGFNILRSKDTIINITLKRKDKTLKHQLKLTPVKDIEGYYRWYRAEKDGESYKMLDNNIGYVTLKNIKEEDVALIKEKFKNAKGIIIDIRNYPSAFMPFRLAPFFVSKDTPFVKFTSGNINYPGEFTFGDNLSVPSQGEVFKGKVVILVNEISQSQAEYTAMSFRAGDNVSIVGSTTAGADGNVSNIPLPGGMSTMISGIGVYYPDGTETQRIGIVPDFEVKPTFESIRNGRDLLIEKAIDIITKNIKIPNKIKD